jgi:hypothetical protein
MDSLDEARAARTAQLEKANGFLERLAYFIGSHADAVDGDDRAQLRELSRSIMKRHTDIAAIVASGPAAVMQLSFVELIAALEETAIAGMATLQVLGGRLARNEVWGGPFEEDKVGEE